MSRRLPSSERARLDPFVIATGDASPRDQRDLMERPFFSLAKSRRTVPILYEAGAVRVEVYAVAEHGMATIWDADILIWAAGQIVEAENFGLSTSRFLRFTPYHLLTAVGRETGASDYKLLKAALTRLQSTSIRTTIRNGEHWRRHQFSWVNEWEELTRHDGRVEGMELVLPERARYELMPGNWSTYEAKLAAEEAARRAAEEEARREQRKSNRQRGKGRSDRVRAGEDDDPYARWSIEELEEAIIEREQRLAETEMKFAAPEFYKDADRSRDFLHPLVTSVRG